MSESPAVTSSSSGPGQQKRVRISTACEGCRKKRAKCDGSKPSCKGCRAAGAKCVYDLQGDRRKPFTKEVVVALQMRVDALEKELAELRLRSSNTNPEPGLPTDPSSIPVDSVAVEVAAPRHLPQDALQGGLALNSHGEVRFFGPTSSYRAILAETTTPIISSSHVEAARAQSLTHAPIPTAAPADPTLPRRPPVLSAEVHTKVVRLAFEYCFSQFGLVQEREFHRDMQLFPCERTNHYSPFLLNVVLAIGSRYLDVAEPFPVEICGDLSDPETRGDCFISWARYLLDQEWLNPKISTVRALTCLAIYLAGRGLDGPCWMYMGQAMRLSEDFGLQLGIHRLSLGSGGLSDALITARRDTFYAAFNSDVMLSMYIGRSTTFRTEEIDQPPPQISQELDFDVPLYRSSTFHYSSTLMLLASDVMSKIYTHQPGVTYEARKSQMSGLHLLLENWYHELPAHARASTTNSSKAPHPHVIQLNLTYFNIMIILHRPFFRRLTLAKTCDNLSTQKCLVCAKHIVRLVKLQKDAHGLRYTGPSFQHAAFCGGTILALSAVEDDISDTPDRDAERREQAQTDLQSIVAALREVARTWSTANTSARVLEALMMQWGADPVPAPGSSDPTLWDPSTAQYDTSSNVAFPFLFPSWDLDPAGTLDDFMALLDPHPLGDLVVDPILMDSFGGA